jgi:Diaphanous FH3 Domain
MSFSFFQIEFMVACMQFINIVVHSVDDMNYRVALQWEFATLGLEEYLVPMSSNLFLRLFIIKDVLTQ